jgi:ABC-2 type transport system ATP-binding protein
MFMDEPTTGLDPRNRQQLWDVIKQLVSGGTTLLLTTQYLEEADILSDSIVILNAGQIVASGTSDDLKRLVGFSYCQVTAISADDVGRIADALADFSEVEVDVDANTVSVPAAQGVATLTEVLRRTEAIGVELVDISLRKPSLDEVFLHLTQPTVTT